MGLHFVKLNYFCFTLLTLVSVMNALINENKTVPKKLKDKEDIICARCNKNLALTLCYKCRTPHCHDCRVNSKIIKIGFCPVCVKMEYEKKKKLESSLKSKKIVKPHDSSVEEPAIIETVCDLNNDNESNMKSTFENWMVGLEDSVSYKDFFEYCVNEEKLSEIDDNITKDNNNPKIIDNE
ncbi:uncharacterized protein LOC126903079 isoform X1 [Daktulosphaira vitifoliae]|uniref:uncharacterized protein LOC126903079 isoform X1 n=1 Tax=Daktulosphaira vitifoliae TaxID=58002 RepID=UPI0021A991BD|nr:uncharacterized protein LOC126903079 isoform X1 [Daktulosphaira vitifoliae]